MSFFVTATGAELDVRYPRPEHFTPSATASALAQMNRFAGQAKRPYSLAEHCLLVSEILERDLRAGVIAQLAGLVHDAHKPWAGADLPSPHKREFGPEWGRWETRWMRHVRSAFAIGTAWLHHGELIRLACRMALATERRDLLPPNPTPWTDLQGIEPVSWVRLNSEERAACTWDHWRDFWLERYEDLDYGRKQISFEVTQP